MPGGQGPVKGCPPGGVTEQVPSGFFITPGIAVGVPEPAGAGVVPVGAAVGCAVGAGCAAGGGEVAGGGDVAGGGVGAACGGAC